MAKKVAIAIKKGGVGKTVTSKSTAVSVGVTVQRGAGAGIHGLPSNSRRKAAKGLTPCLRAVAT